MQQLTDRPVLTLADLEAFDPEAPARGRERRFCCPLPGCAEKRHDGRHRSLSLNLETGEWHCHRCGGGGLVRERWPHREPRFNARRASSRRAFALSGGSGPPSPGEAVNVERKPVRPGHGDRWRLIFERAPQLAVDPGAAYLESRGISLGAAQACGARYLATWPHWEAKADGQWILRGTSRRVVFPVQSDGGDLAAIQGRVIGPDEYGPKVLTRGDLSAGVFRSSRSALDGPLIVVVEAPIDALSLGVAGVPAVALCGTSIPKWLPRSAAFRRIVLAFDADKAGDDATSRAASEFRTFGCAVERWRPSLKDWNEVLLTHGAEALRRSLMSDIARSPGWR